MSTNIKNGFTIIELILFFGVTGILFIGILAGSGVAVAQQRYRDSVHSLQTVIQQQYSEVANVVNDRANNLMCNSSGTIAPLPTGSSPRGTSGSCVLMGRYIQSYSSSSGLSDGQALHIYPVIAAASSELPDSTSSDTEAFAHFNLIRHTAGYELQRLEWDNVAGIRAGSSTTNQFSILILRSPLTGSIRTYAASGASVNDPDNMISNANLQRELMICVDPPAGNIISGDRMAVRLSAGASNQSGVEMLSQTGGNGC